MTLSHVSHAALSALLVILPVLATGCGATAPSGSYPIGADPQRDPELSRRLAGEAARLMTADPARAEALLRAALNADLYNGPAHNNLGTLLLAQDRLYDAAEEFEWARQLMPGHPDPRLNLALALERAGRTSEALATYGTALELAPEHIPVMQALVRLQLKAGRTDDRTPRLLDEIALRGDSPQWRAWAAGQRARLPR